MDTQLTIEAHVNNVCKLQYIQLRNIGGKVTSEATKKIVQELVTSRLDHCNVPFFDIF